LRTPEELGSLMKTILVHLDRTKRTNERIKIAATVALANDAHLVGAAMVGVSTKSFERSGIDNKDPSLAEHLKFLQGRAAQGTRSRGCPVSSGVDSVRTRPCLAEEFRDRLIAPLNAANRI
jgi:hypothetical protein